MNRTMATDKNVRLCQPTGQTVLTITTTEMHTGGEPVRIIESGFPKPRGETILDKINDLRQNYDHLRKFVILEPRGHFDMYAVLLVPPDNPEADIGAIFLHNEGYSTMCGHACVALGRYAVDNGLIELNLHQESTTEAQVNIQVPCGLVKTFVSVQEDGDVIRTGRVRFESVPSFVVCQDVCVQVEGYGDCQIDVAYGGAFYAFVSSADLSVDLQSSPIAEIAKAATALKAAVSSAVSLHHPETPAFLYGIMVVDSRKAFAEDGVYHHTCIFADSETDRSPCGSGCTARAALMFQRGQLKLGQTCTFRSGVTGSEFQARVVNTSRVDLTDAVVVEVEGQGYYSGRNILTLEEGDSLGKGFIVR
ncbi:trans-L-3-hydroxyproline dehydratase-like isoform X1 [Biomphalaria glabrata]|uniref:trans-L-3-hydroxyproline dehydratase n=1 Tax=Biomphalaria glabrata TaxID=6526 RepID=A0A9W2ZZC8_BIOGL|nr:trans-L-3-hydroxyproline dehydratase-like isoform X1 [Biomphalaria glabrata]XP_055880303.1 trans-L-3-hydroxyproline dehydratase-like isoform X1 [Biomphalaria glabrata]XP_055880304.1 trans-L-3-hydroxyproline dehydratase-like isoform X1 [Biomphalaria glabrata]XP_055880305.1 trans-L-3-hydroxyproline dehydratase-like isoform X1 [Biomphalaria glabrata]